MDIVNGIKDFNKKCFADPYENGIQRFDKLSSYVDMAIKGLGDNTVSAIEVAKALYYIQKDKLYEGYPVPGGTSGQRFHDFVSFCKEFFVCGKSTVYNYIALYERFAGEGSADLLPLNFKVAEYTYTQLLLMRNLSVGELSKIKPSMSCSEIKKFVKELGKEENGVISNRLENSQEDTEEAAEIVKDEVVEEVTEQKCFSLDVLKSILGKWLESAEASCTKYYESASKVPGLYENADYLYGVAFGRRLAVESILAMLSEVSKLIK